MNKKRNVSFELLRIIMMLQVIFLHISLYGGYTDCAKSLGMGGKLVYWVLWLMSRCPVYIFIILMGYFACESGTKLKVDKVLKIYISMFFYSVLITVFFGIFRPGEVNFKFFLRSLIPFSSATWYFMTLYLLMMILTPYINRMLDGIEKKEFTILIGLCTFIFCIWQHLAMVAPFKDFFSVYNVIETGSGKSLYDFIFMYLLGAYMRRYKGMQLSKIVYLIAFIVFGMINVALVAFYPDSEINHVVTNNDNFFVVLQCVCLFRIFEGFKMKKSGKTGQLICYISAGNLGVYMIHEHPLVRNLLWTKIVKIHDPAFFQSPLLIFKLLIIMVLVYAVCWVIDLLRRLVIGLIVSK